MRSVDRNRNVTPISTSHHPMTPTHCEGVNTGIQDTVASTSGPAGDRPSGFNRPRHGVDYFG